MQPRATASRCAARLLRAGTRSTLHAANRAAAPLAGLPGDPAAEILFDPQTAGGLLAAVAQEKAGAILSDLPGAARIGRMTEGPSLLTVIGEPAPA